MLKIANGASEDSNSVKNVAVTWDTMLERLSKPRVSPDTRSYMLTGQCPSGIRGQKRGDRVKETYLLMIDLDHNEKLMSWEDFSFYLQINMPYQYAAYTTRSYQTNDVHFRIIVPFSGPLDALKHRAAVEYIAQFLPNDVLPALDKCSFNADQPIFLPCIAEEGLPFEFDRGGDEFFNPATMDLQSDDEYIDDDDDIERALLAQPLDLTETEVQAYLDALDPCTLTYGMDEGVFGWATVGAALAHQFAKSEKGFDLWLRWSERNPEKHNARGMKAKYQSFEILPRGRRPVTFASVVAQVRVQGGIMGQVSGDSGKTLFDELIERASLIETIGQYNELRAKVQAIGPNLLPDDARLMIAHEIVMAIGKKHGLTKTVVVKALTPQKIRGNSADDDAKPLPDWLEGWCYIEKQCQFYCIESDHGIVKEAFNARFDRMPECIMAESNAARFALVDCRIPTYADMMYWPGAARVFEHENKEMVNGYTKSGVEPAVVLSDAGKEAVRLMLEHTKMLVPDERERNIVLDWLAWTYQKPGNRINWALLIQGIQGAGKSYYAKLMSYLLGRNTKTIEPAAINNRFTGWAHGAVLIVVEEIRVQGESKFIVMDRMKPFITNDVIQIEEKGRDHRNVPNFTNYLMLTNHKDALPINDNERRYCVIYTAIQSQEHLYEILGGEKAAEEYFNRLFGSLEDNADAIAHYFKHRVISESFRAKGRAPETRALQTMKSMGKSTIRSDVESAIVEFECDAINEKIIDVTHFRKLCEGHGIDLIKTSGLSAILSDMGYEPIAKRVKIENRLHTIWYRPGAVSEMDAINKVKDFMKLKGFIESVEKGQFDDDTVSDQDACPF